MTTNNLRSNHLRSIASRLGQKINITLLTLFLGTGTAARIEAGEWQLRPPDGPGCWKQKVSLAEMKWLPCSRGEPRCLCRDGEAQQTVAAMEDIPEDDDEPVIDVTTTALKAACNKAVNDIAGMMWILSRAAAATGDPTFSEEFKSSIDDRTQEFLDDWRLTYGPGEQEIGKAFETGYEVIDLGLAAYGIGKIAITAGRKVIAHFGREAAETASGNGLREAVRASISQTDEATAAAAPESVTVRKVVRLEDLPAVRAGGTVGRPPRTYVTLPCDMKDLRGIEQVKEKLTLDTFPGSPWKSTDTALELELRVSNEGFEIGEGTYKMMDGSPAALGWTEGGAMDLTMPSPSNSEVTGFRIHSPGHTSPWVQGNPFD